MQVSDWDYSGARAEFMAPQERALDLAVEVSGYNLHCRKVGDGLAALLEFAT